MGKITIATAIWKGEKYYVSQGLNVDVANFGQDKVDVLRNLKEALELYFRDMPTSKTAKIERISIRF